MTLSEKETMLTVITLIIVGYLVGSIPAGYLSGKILKNIDVRQHGSGSTGATNVLRCVGKGPAVFVLVFDVAKGAFPVWLATYMGATAPLAFLPEYVDSWHLVPPIVAFATLIGHSKPLFLNFQGGKSAATALGTVISMNWLAASLSFALWVGLVISIRLVSFASIVAVLSSSLFMYLCHAHASYIAYCLLGGIFVIYRHKANIKRLLAGTEPRIGQKTAE